MPRGPAGEEVAEFLWRLYDSNADAELSTPEFLTAAVLEATVADGDVSAALFQLFDKVWAQALLVAW